MENNLMQSQETLKATSVVKILGVTTVSQSLGVSRATVLRWFQAGKIDGFFRIGRKWLIRREDFDQFINRKIKQES